MCEKKTGKPPFFDTARWRPKPEVEEVEVWRERLEVAAQLRFARDRKQTHGQVRELGEEPLPLPRRVRLPSAFSSAGDFAKFVFDSIYIYIYLGLEIVSDEKPTECSKRTRERERERGPSAYP